MSREFRQPFRNTDGTWSIPLTQGFHAIVNDQDIHVVNSVNWFALTNRKVTYAARAGKAGESSTVYLHRVITDAPAGMQVDHVDGNGLNNIRANLRICTHLQNMQNKSTYANSPTGFRGVYPVPNGKYIARIRVDGRWLNLGTFDTPEQAALARDKASLIHYGDFAQLNIIERQAS